MSGTSTPSAPGPRTGAGPRATATGGGRVLVLVYGLLAVAATARSAVQILRDLAEAPVAYLLSGFAALVYVVATIALARSGPRWRAVAWGAVGVEMVGVLVVGTVSLAMPEHFERATVWSTFGAGYGFVPLVLPVVGLWWLRRTRAAAPDVPAGAVPPGVG